jgi:hypothetical protein
MVCCKVLLVVMMCMTEQTVDLIMIIFLYNLCIMSIEIMVLLGFQRR